HPTHTHSHPRHPPPPPPAPPCSDPPGAKNRGTMRCSLAPEVGTVRIHRLNATGVQGPLHWAANSAVRVPSSHGGSRWFESSAAHYKSHNDKDLRRLFLVTIALRSPVTIAVTIW